MRQPAVITLLAAALMCPNAGHAQETFPPPSPELLAPRPRTLAAPALHPAVALVDADGAPVLQSQKPIAAASCGSANGCHDVDWILTHGYHTRLGADEQSGGKAPSGRPWDSGPGLTGRWDPIDYDFVPKSGERPSLAAGVRARIAGDDCVLCHAKRASNEARLREVEAGRPEWALTATLIDTGIVRRDGERLVYEAAAFDALGQVSAERLGLGRPRERACGFCHGVVHAGEEPLSAAHFTADGRSTDTQGVVFSAQRMSQSALDIAGKDSLSRPWDVHAERLLSCSNCHFSPNHPAYSLAGSADSPAHLKFDARRVEVGEYLRRPDHDFAKGASAQGTVADRLDGTIRRCEQCHDAPAAHAWLPRAERHFAALRCESCHVPAAQAPARSETDWTMLSSPGQARVVYRGVKGQRLEGFRPVLLPRRDPDGSTRLAPHNLVTTWFWTEDSPEGERPVARQLLSAAFFVEHRHHPDLLHALDRNADERLDQGELVLDTEAKISAARARLIAAGAHNPRIRGELQPYGIHHGIAPGRFATRECETCHASDSRLTESFSLSERAPFGVIPALVADANVTLPGTIERDSRGGLALELRPRSLAGHVFGLTKSGTVDLLGGLVVLGVLFGAATHGSLRFLASRRRKEST